VAAEALAVKQENGTARIVPGGYVKAVEHVAALWKGRTKANAHDPSFTLTLNAPTSSDTRGTAIREQRRDVGQIDPDLVRVNTQGQNGIRFELAPTIRCCLNHLSSWLNQPGGEVSVSRDRW